LKFSSPSSEHYEGVLAAASTLGLGRNVHPIQSVFFAFSLEIKRAEDDVDQLRVSGAEVKNMWSSISTPTYMTIKHRRQLYFQFLCGFYINTEYRLYNFHTFGGSHTLDQNDIVAKVMFWVFVHHKKLYLDYNMS
jgi:hypothetical protein